MTGSGSGIGQGCAMMFARHGAGGGGCRHRRGCERKDARAPARRGARSHTPPGRPHAPGGRRRACHEGAATKVASTFSIINLVSAAAHAALKNGPALAHTAGEGGVRHWRRSLHRWRCACLVGELDAPAQQHFGFSRRISVSEGVERLRHAAIRVFLPGSDIGACQFSFRPWI